MSRIFCTYNVQIRIKASVMLLFFNLVWKMKGVRGIRDKLKHWCQMSEKMAHTYKFTWHFANVIDSKTCSFLFKFCTYTVYNIKYNGLQIIRDLCIKLSTRVPFTFFFLSFPDFFPLSIYFLYRILSAFVLFLQDLISVSIHKIMMTLMRERELLLFTFYFSPSTRHLSINLV